MTRKVKYTDRPKLSKEDPEAKARTGIFGLVAPKPATKPKRAYVKKKVLPPQKNKMSSYLGKK